VIKIGSWSGAPGGGAPSHGKTGTMVNPALQESFARTRNSSVDEIANANFLYDDIIHALQNIIDSYINSAMHRSTRLEHRFTEFR